MLGSQDLTVAYYLCDSYADGKDLCGQICRAWALQILRANLDLVPYVANNYVYKGISPSASQMKKLVPELLGLTLSSRIVLDGIDECAERDQKLVLQEIQSILRSSGSYCKVLISSRDTVTVHKALAKFPKISLKEKKEKVDTDIRQFIRHALIDLEDRFDRSIVEELAEKLISEADGSQHSRMDETYKDTYLTRNLGMFLWARLVITMFEDQHNIQELREAANSLPEGLDQAYE